MKRSFLFLILISVVVFITRFYQLTQSPPGLTIDEVAIGYNAYSILKTGRDEWGNFLPINFRSVGDYKSPVLVYLTVPSIALFGLNELGTRLPVALFSAISVYLFWLLASRYFFEKKYTAIPYLATLIYSLSPWLIVYSRSGFEAVVALTFLLANLLFALEFRQTGRFKHLILMLSFAFLSAITYHSTKMVVPLLNVLFIVYHFRYFAKLLTSWFIKKRLVFSLGLLILICFGSFFLKYFIFGPGSTRAGMTFLSKDFDYHQALLPTFSQRSLFFLTPTLGLISFWYKRFLEYFSANFYLTSGLGLVTPSHPGQGAIYQVEYLFLVVGLILLLFKNRFLSSRPIHFLLLAWLFLSFLPGSLTNNSQHPLRSLNAVPVVCILITLGMIFLWENCQNNVAKLLFIAFIVLGYLWGITRFADFYTLHYPTELSETRSYGWKQMAIYARDHHEQYDHVYVDPRFGTDGPYTYGVPNMYFLFYNQYNPVLYVNYPARKSLNTNFENFVFTEINWPEFDHTKNNLYIASPWSIPVELLGSDKQKYHVEFLNNSSGLYAISDK